MMIVNNKEEVGTQGQRLNEPNFGVPIKKRPFQLTNPAPLDPSARPLDEISLTPKHYTPKSPLDFPPMGFDPGNPSSSDLDKPAGMAMNPLQNLNAIDMGRNFGPLKSIANPNFRMEMQHVGNGPKLDLSISGNMMKNDNFNQCSTDLSLTRPSTISSKACSKSSHNHSNTMGKRSVLDLNLPTAETWDSPMDCFTSENDGIARTEPVEALTKQGSVSGMIPQGVCSGVIPNGLVTGLVPKGAGNSLKSPNIEGPSVNCNPSEVTLDLQLKLPPRPELRMKNLEPVYSSDLSLSLSGKDLNSSAKPVNAKPETVGYSQKSKEKNITNPNVTAVAQSQVIVKQESHEVALAEKVVPTSGLKDQCLPSGSAVKKEPVDTCHAQQSIGKLVDKSPCSESELRLAKQAEIFDKNSLTKGIDLNSATPLPEVCTGGKMVNTVLEENVVVGQVVQSAISHVPCHNSENIDTRKLSLDTSCVVPTSSPLGASEDIKPVIPCHLSPALVVHNDKRMVPMASDGFSQGSADMDCSEEGQNLPKSATTVKTMENGNCETNASSSSSFAQIPKQEPCTIGEFENDQVREAMRGENVKSLVPSSTPTSEENKIQIPAPTEARSVQNNEKDIISSSTKLINLPNKIMQSPCLDMEAGSKSRSPSTSMSRRDKEVDLQSSERENGTSSRQIEGNNRFHRRFNRTDSDPDRAHFQRMKSRMSHWDEGSNIQSNRGQKWEGHRFSKFDGDRIENEENLGRGPGNNMVYRTRQTNRFNSRFGHSKSRGFRFTRTRSNSDINFDEGNDSRRNHPHPPRFQNRRTTDVSPRGANGLDGPVFEHTNNHYKRFDNRIERSSSPGPRRGLHQWTPPGEMSSGHPDLLTRVDTRVRSPDRRSYFKKDNLNRRHISPRYNRGRKPGRAMHWNNVRQRSDMVGPHGPVAEAQDLEAYDELRCHGGEMMQFYGRYPDNDGTYSDGGSSHGRIRNCETAMTRLREVGDPDEYRYNNRGIHGWRDGNSNNSGDKLKRRRYQ